MTVPETDRVPLLIWGASGHAKVVADAAGRSRRFRVVGFIDNLAPDRAGAAFAGLTVLGGEEQLDQLLGRGVTHMAVAIGDNTARLSIGERAQRAGFTLATVIHPSAVVADSASLGQGSFVAAGGVINPDVVCDELVIVNTGATIDHDCRLARGVHVSPGAHLAGNVTVGSRAWIGIGASVREGMTIGADSVVGAGGVVVRSLPSGVVAYGVPAIARTRRTDATS